MGGGFFVSSCLAILIACMAVGAQAQTEPLGGQPPPGTKPSVSDLDRQVTTDKALDEANAKGSTVVDMKTDWRTVLPASH
jgi:hypothetical protein